MEEQTREEIIPPVLGRALHLHLRPAARLTWVGAGWAAICGIVAGGTPHLSADTVARALLTLALADSVLGAAWMALFKVRDTARSELSDPDHQPSAPVTDSRVSVEPRVIKALRPADDKAPEDQTAVKDLNLESAATSFWASIAAGLDGFPRPRLFDNPSLRLSSAQAWWPDLTAAHGQLAMEIGLPYGLALLLGLVLGRGVAVVVGLGLLFPLVVWFALGRHSLRGGWTRAVLEIGLPWTIGLAAFTSFPATDLGGLSGLALSTVFWAGEHVTALAVATLFVAAYCGTLTLDQSLLGIERRALVNPPQVAAVVLLVAWRQPILAGVAAMLVLAQMLFQPYLRQRRMRWYLHSTQWMFMGVMLIAAIGIAASHL